MVVIEELDAAATAKFAPAARAGGAAAVTNAAFVVIGAGWDDANGLYAPNGKVWHEAPVYENDRKCLLSREPHRSQKTGKTSYGWILGQERKPLYAVQCESLVPPDRGWRKFNGALPLPELSGRGSVEEAARAAAQAWKDQGNELFAARRYDEADAKWTRALDLADRDGGDVALQVALYSNRAEGRLRRQMWEAALGDAQAALERNPTHDKALLRAAVAAKELKRYMMAQDFVQACLDEHPDHPRAHEVLAELATLVEDERREYPDRAKSAKAKLRESIRREAQDGDLSSIPKAFAAKDTNSTRGFKAFAGYSETRASGDSQPALSSLPYHNMGLPQDQVKLMDQFFQDLRAKKAEKAKTAREEEATYEHVKEEYRELANQSLAAGLLEPLEGILESEKAGKTLGAAEELQRARAEELEEEQQQQPMPQRTFKVERARLCQEDANEVDALFAPLAGQEAASSSAGADREARVPPAGGGSDRRQRIEKAKPFVRGTGSAQASQAREEPRGSSDRRTALERQLDREEAEERRETDRRVLAELGVLRAAKRGEPTRFEQAATELYCWWRLPPEVSGRDVTVSESEGGLRLTVIVRGVTIFDRSLFDRIRANDIVWSVGSSELHVTLTKGEKNKLWEQLGEVPDLKRDDAGLVLAESIPEPLSASDRIGKFQEMLTGDDGSQVDYGDLDPSGRRFVDTVHRYKSALASGDRQGIAEAELDLEEFGRLVI